MVRVEHLPHGTLKISLEPNVGVCKELAEVVEDTLAAFRGLPLNRHTVEQMAAKVRLALYEAEERGFQFKVIE